MNRDTLNLLQDSFERIPQLSGYTVDSFHIKQLSGYTNLNFRLSLETADTQIDWILRIPKEQTNRHINRQIEDYNAAIAYQLSLAPRCLWQDSDGYRLSETISPSRSLAAQDLRDPDIQSKVIAAIQALHQSDSSFKGSVDIEQLISRYFYLMPESKQIALTDHFKAIRATAKKIIRQSKPLVPSHNDLVLDNILFDDHRIWLIDWEYAAMASPYWDIATLCNAAELTAAEAEKCLDLYDYYEDALEVDELNAYRDVLNALSIYWMAAFTDHQSVK